MVDFFSGLLTFILAGLSLFIVFIILIQRTSGGLGTSMSSSVNSAFGGQTNTVLTRTTIYSVVSFFIFAFILYLLMLRHPQVPSQQLPNLVDEPAPASLTELSVPLHTSSESVLPAP